MFPLTNTQVGVNEASGTSEVLFCGVSINDCDKFDVVEVSNVGISNALPGLSASYL